MSLGKRLPRKRHRRRGKAARQSGIMRSLHDTVLSFPDETVVVPGLGELTTICEERESNPFLLRR